MEITSSFSILQKNECCWQVHTTHSADEVFCVSVCFIHACSSFKLPCHFPVVCVNQLLVAKQQAAYSLLSGEISRYVIVLFCRPHTHTRAHLFECMMMCSVCPSCAKLIWHAESTDGQLRQLYHVFTIIIAEILTFGGSYILVRSNVFKSFVLVNDFS